MKNVLMLAALIAASLVPAQECQPESVRFEGLVLDMKSASVTGLEVVGEDWRLVFPGGQTRDCVLAPREITLKAL